jgi:hypothetical protein
MPNFKTSISHSCRFKTDQIAQISPSYISSFTFAPQLIALLFPSNGRSKVVKEYSLSGCPLKTYILFSRSARRQKLLLRQYHSQEVHSWSMWLIFRTNADRTVIVEFAGEETVGHAADIFLKNAGLPPAPGGVDAYTFAIGNQPLGPTTKLTQFENMTVITVSKKDDITSGHSQGSRRPQDALGRSPAAPQSYPLSFLTGTPT